MVSASKDLFRAMGLIFCFGLANALHAQYEVTIQNQNDGQWTLKKIKDKDQIDSVKVGSEDIKMNLVSNDSMRTWEIKGKQIAILKMAPRHRGVGAGGHFYICDSNDNTREFELKMDNKSGVMASSFKEIRYNLSAKSPMIECKSSGDNKDDGVTELRVIDSKPVIIIKAPRYPIAGQSKP